MVHSHFFGVDILHNIQPFCASYPGPFSCDNFWRFAFKVAILLISPSMYGLGPECISTAIVVPTAKGSIAVELLVTLIRVRSLLKQPSFGTWRPLNWNTLGLSTLHFNQHFFYCCVIFFFFSFSLAKNYHQWKVNYNYGFGWSCLFLTSHDGNLVWSQAENFCCSCC